MMNIPLLEILTLHKDCQPFLGLVHILTYGDAHILGARSLLQWILDVGALTF
jgi:hypothetical protein